MICIPRRKGAFGFISERVLELNTILIFCPSIVMKFVAVRNGLAIRVCFFKIPTFSSSEDIFFEHGKGSYSKEVEPRKSSCSWKIPTIFSHVRLLILGCIDFAHNFISKKRSNLGFFSCSNAVTQHLSFCQDQSGLGLALFFFLQD